MTPGGDDGDLIPDFDGPAEPLPDYSPAEAEQGAD